MKELLELFTEFGYDEEEGPVVVCLPFKKYLLMEGKHRIIAIEIFRESKPNIRVRCLRPNFSAAIGEQLLRYFQEKRTINSSNQTFYDKVPPQLAD